MQFLLPVTMSGEDIRAVRMTYEKEGWVRCLSEGLDFVWLHQEASDKPKAEGARGQIDAMAFVRQVSKGVFTARGCAQRRARARS